jgi:hypothetical protein
MGQRGKPVGEHLDGAPAGKKFSVMNEYWHDPQFFIEENTFPCLALP